MLIAASFAKFASTSSLKLPACARVVIFVYSPLKGLTARIQMLVWVMKAAQYWINQIPFVHVDLQLDRCW